METPIDQKVTRQTNFKGHLLHQVREMVQTCIQCGTCSGSCPNEFAMDHTPRHMWRMVIMGDEKGVFDSKTFEMCSSCYSCTLRCPRGLPLTEAMHSLKLVDALENPDKNRKSKLFYQKFVDSIEQHGRVHEMEMMTKYFLAMHDPFIVLKYASLGMKLLSKGKIPLHLTRRDDISLAAIFKKTQEIEGIR